MTSISVIVAALNAASTIEEQLAALAMQDDPSIEYEVLACDNGSQDETRELVLRRAREDARFRLIDASASPGAGPARNIGVRHAQGEFVAFCDADDVADRRWLSAMAAALQTCDVVAGRVETASLNPNWTRIARPLPEDIQTGSFLPFAGAGNLALHRRIFQELGGFDPALTWLEDVDLSWRLQLAGYEIGFAADAMVHVRLRRSIAGIYTQGVHYGSALALLEQRYRSLMRSKQGSGAPARSGSRWDTMLATMSTVAHHPGRGGWGYLLWQLGWHIGHHRGSGPLSGQEPLAA